MFEASTTEPRRPALDRAAKAHALDLARRTAAAVNALATKNASSRFAGFAQSFSGEVVELLERWFEEVD